MILQIRFVLVAYLKTTLMILNVRVAVSHRFVMVWIKCVATAIQMMLVLVHLTAQILNVLDLIRLEAMYLLHLLVSIRLVA